MKGRPMSFLRPRHALRAALAVLGAFLVGALAPLPGQAIQLRTGEVLVGEVVDATSEGLSFRRLDTGGFLDLDAGQAEGEGALGRAVEVELGALGHRACAEHRPVQLERIGVDTRLFAHVEVDVGHALRVRLGGMLEYDLQDAFGDSGFMHERAPL